MYGLPAVCSGGGQCVESGKQKFSTPKSVHQEEDQVKKLVNEGIDASTVGDFEINEQKTFYGVPPLIAAILTGNETIVNYLVGKYPHFRQFRVEKVAKKSDCLILPTGNDLEEQLDVVEAIGVTCLLHGNHGARKFGWTCLESAILLRLSQLVPFKTSYITHHL